MDADHETETAVGDVADAARLPGAVGAMSSGVLADTGADWIEWLPAASNASIVYV